MPNKIVNGVEIYYEIHGQGPPLVVLAGQGTGPDARRPLIDGLAATHSVLTFDPRGTGRSKPAFQGVSVEALTSDALGLMDAVGFDKAIVLALSTGTGQGTVMAADYPDRVSRLILASCWTHADADLQTLQRLRMTAARTLPADAYVHFNSLLLYYPPYRRLHAKRFDESARQAVSKPQDAAGFASRLASILAFDARPFYERIVCPTLVCGAQDDLIMPVWFARDAARFISHSRLFLVEEGGHMFFESRTDVFLAAVHSFLQEIH